MAKLIIFILFFTTQAFAINNNSFKDREDVKSFFLQMHKEHDFSLAELADIFDKTNTNPEIIKRITTPFEQVSWDRYRKLFLNNKRITNGVKFWKEHQATLTAAENKYGVPAEIIVAILGIESHYGNHKGQYQVLEALSTLAFDYPPRSQFFKDELREFLLLTKEQKLNPKTIKGSYAGAIGLPQFISSCYRSYAVDFNNVGKIDLINDIPTAIGSVANYFKAHGWQPEAPVLYPASFKGKKYKKLQETTKKSPRPSVLVKNLNSYGISPKSLDIKPDMKVAPIIFDNANKNDCWLGLNNFYVITRYNHNNQYAMAVYELSQAIAKQYRS